MKKAGLLLSLLTSVILLTGCGERADLIEEGKNAYVTGDFSKSYDSLLKAHRLEPLTDGDYKVFHEVQSALYTDYYDKGDEANNNFRYEEALVLYENATDIYNGDEELPVKIASVKQLIEKQKKFDEYVIFYEDVLEDSNKTMDELNKEVDALFVGAVSEKNFIIKVKGLLSNSNIIVSKLDESFTILEDDGIIEIHQNLIDVIQYQHKTLQTALNYDQEYGNSLDSISERLIEVKRSKTNVHQTLKTYAKENLLLFNFNKKDKNVTTEEQTAPTTTSTPEETPSNN